MEMVFMDLVVEKRAIIFSERPASLQFDGWAWGPIQVKGEFEFTDQPAGDPAPCHVVDAPAP